MSEETKEEKFKRLGDKYKKECDMLDLTLYLGPDHPVFNKHEGNEDE